LPLPLVIPEVMALQTLADVQTLMRHLPEDRRERSTWRHVAAQLEAATLKGDTKDVAIALRMVLTLEGIEWHPKSGRAASPPPWSVEGHQLVSQIVNTIGCRNFDNQLGGDYENPNHSGVGNARRLRARRDINSRAECRREAAGRLLHRRGYRHKGSLGDLTEADRDGRALRRRAGLPEAGLHFRDNRAVISSCGPKRHLVRRGGLDARVGFEKTVRQSSGSNTLSEASSINAGSSTHERNRLTVTLGFNSRNPRK
jgi:hypothetical protein